MTTPYIIHSREIMGQYVSVQLIETFYRIFQFLSATLHYTDHVHDPAACNQNLYQLIVIAINILIRNYEAFSQLEKRKTVQMIEICNFECSLNILLKLILTP